MRIHKGKEFFALVDSFVDIPGNEREYNLKKVISLCQLHDKSISWNHYQAVNFSLFPDKCAIKSNSPCLFDIKSINGQQYYGNI